MIKKIIIGSLLLLMVNSQWLMAQELTVEQEQQFTYYWYAAKEAIDQERYTDALVLLEFCRLINPHDGETLMFLAVLYNGMGQKERAVATLKEAFEAAPRDQWQKYSYALLDQRTLEAAREALRVMERAYEEGQKDEGKKTKGKKTPAIKDEELLEQLRRMYMATGQWSKAIAMQDELDQLNGFDAYSAINRFRAYAAWNKPKKAMEAVDKYLELDPKNVQFLLFKLEILERSKTKMEVLYALYEQILELDPMNRLVLNNYAYHLATHGGDLQKAERMSAITIHEEPSNPVYLDTYGWILHLQGQNELALFYLNRALTNSDEQKVKAEIEKHLNEIK